MTRLSRIAIAAAALCGVVFASQAHAQSYPNRPITVIVPFGAGSATDTICRIVVQQLGVALNTGIVVENKAGAIGAIAGAFVARAAPDGYTLLMATSSTVAINASIYKNLSYDPAKDFSPISLLEVSVNVVCVHPSVPAKNLGELIALAKAKPGTLNYGSSGIGSNYHMAGELLKTLTGIDIVHVPYKGSTGARTDILGGQIQLLFDSVPSIAPMIKAGTVRALGTSGKSRSAILPDVPTLSEAGVPGFQATLWVGFMAPKGTPQPIVERLNREINAILKRPDIKAAWEKQGATPIMMTQPEFKAFMEAQIEKWAKVIKANNIQLIN
jgi:tripartite-type tricarboxylate transporter receptor subunit TctC